jgi:hypothetical protein
MCRDIYDSTHARNRVDRTRAGNLYKRQLRDIPRKLGRRRAAARSLASYEASHGQE